MEPTAVANSSSPGDDGDMTSWERRYEMLFLRSMHWLHIASLASVFLGMGTNFLNFCVFWCEPVRRHCLTPCLRLLSANDFLLLLTFLLLTQTNLHHTGWVPCFLANYVFGAATALSAWLLVAITLDRVFFLRAPQAEPASAARATRMACTALAGALAWNLHWAWSAGFGGYFGEHREGSGGGGGGEDNSTAAGVTAQLCVATAGKSGQAMQLADSLLASFIPGVALMALNAHIVRQLRRLTRSLQAAAAAAAAAEERRQAAESDNHDDTEEFELEPLGVCRTVTWSTSDPLQASQNRHPSHQNRIQQQQQCQASRMLVGFCLAYLAFNLPNYISLVLGLTLFSSLDGGSSGLYAAYNIIRLAAQLLYLIHFTSNSLIYAYANKQFRLALRNFIVKFRCCRCQMQVPR